MATYYVNKASGSDSNNGTSSSTPFQTVAKINALNLQPGDTVLFAGGQVWYETLRPRTSGTESNPITFDSYGGDGKRAVFDAAKELRWSDWQSVGQNQWQTSVAKEGYLNPGKVYVNGEALGGESPNSGSVNAPGEWNWTSGKLTVYATSNPRGTEIAMQVRDEAIRLDFKDNLVFEDLNAKRGFNGVTLYEGADNNTFENVSSHRNTLHGFWIRDSDNTELDGVRAYKNGQPFTKLTELKTGEGVWLDARTDNTTIRDSAVYENEQHGVNFSHATGNNHKIINVISHSNGEAGLAIAGGNQSVTGSTIYGNGLGGIVATLNAKTMTLKDNVITAPTDKNYHALYARGAGDARFVSEDNKYKGDIGHIVYLQAEAGDNSTFKDDLFTAAKTKPYLPLVWLDGGENHSFDHVSIVSKAGQSVPIAVYANASATMKNSFIYGTGHHLVGDVDGGGYWGTNNNYYKPDSPNFWITKGNRYFNEADIDAGRVDTGSTTKTMTPAQIENAWAKGTDPVSLSGARKAPPTDDGGLRIGASDRMADKVPDLTEIAELDIPEPIKRSDPLFEMTDRGASTIDVLEGMKEAALDRQAEGDALIT